jgi:oligoendopeptidase F
MTKKRPLPVWDLSELYAAAADPRLEADIRRVGEMAAAFAARYRGRLADPDTVAAALVEMEAIDQLFGRIRAYVYLEFSTDTAGHAFKALLVRTDELGAALDEQMVFFRLELLALPETAFAAIAASPRLAGYRHYLRQLGKYRPHQLEEKEEVLVGKKDITGKSAFVRLYDEVTSAFTFTLTVDGERRTLPSSAMRSLLYHPDPKMRAQATRVLYARYKKFGPILTTVFNSIVKDHGIECGLRRYADPESPTHLANQVEEGTIRRMMTQVADAYPLVQAYYRLKARIMGLKRVKGSDLYAPVGEAVRDIPYPEAERMVREAYASFDPEFGEQAGRFFERSWIHAEVRSGKRGGAYCYSPGPSEHPYVLVNYTGQLRDVYTLAHELGHGLHGLLAAGQTYLNYHPPLVAAETASVFGEMLLSDAVRRRLKRRGQRIGFYCNKIEDMIATVFRQNMYTAFEMDVHRRIGREILSPEELGEAWWREQARLYGDAVAFLPLQRWTWSAIPHFFHSRFYCYAYSFGELFVLCLHQKYREEGASFVERYKALLRAGGSASPYELAASVGESLDSDTFWEKGLTAIGEWIHELEGEL